MYVMIINACNITNINIQLNTLLADIDNLEMLFISVLGRVVEKPTKEDIVRFTGSPSLLRKLYTRFIKIWVILIHLVVLVSILVDFENIH